MSAIEEILEKETHTLLERCVVSVWFEGNSRDEEVAEMAAAELAALRAERDEAVRLLKEIHSMNDIANLNDAELWNVNGEFEKRIVALIRDSSEPVQND